MVLADEYSARAMRALNLIEGVHPRFVPGHFWVEVTNALLVAERRRRASRTEITEAIRGIYSLPLITDDETRLRCADTALSLAREHGLTMYDAAYLELASRRSATLATIDKALTRAARKIGVAVIPE